MECHVIVHVTVEEYVSSLSRVTVENAYLEEKEDACNALGEIAVQTGLDHVGFTCCTQEAVEPLQLCTLVPLLCAVISLVVVVCRAVVVYCFLYFCLLVVYCCAVVDIVCCLLLLPCNVFLLQTMQGCISAPS